MKKILALIMVVIVCVSLCACGNKKDKSNKSAQTEITGINDFKWGMTKKEVKKIIKENINYELKEEKKKEIECDYDEGILEYETIFKFKRGMLEEINMDTDADESIYNGFIEENKGLYDRMTKEGELKGSKSSYFYSKTTYLCLIYLKGIESVDYDSSIAKMYSRYKPDEYYEEYTKLDD